MTLYSHHELDDLGGGRFQSVHSIRPIAYNPGSGYRRITNVLGATGDPARPLGVDELVQFRLRPKLAGASPVVHFGHGPDHVRYTPLDTNNVTGLQVGDSAFLYPEAWNNADLYMAIGGHRLYKEVRLRAGHPSVFQFRIDAHGDFDPATLTFGSFRVLQPSLDNPVTGESIPLVWDVSQQGGKYILTVALPTGNYAGWVLDPQLVLTPDATSGKDTGIEGVSGTTRNYGAAPNFGWGLLSSLRKILIEFDCSSISAAATCTSATLATYHAVQGSATAWAVTIYSIAVGNKDWIEGTQNNAQALAGEPCWNALAADGAGGVTTAWAGAAGLVTSGTDYEASSIGSFSGNRSDVVGTAYSAALTASRVTGWFGSTNTNYGMIFVGSSNDTGGIALSDHATAAYRPSLTVNYSLSVSGASLPRHGGHRMI